jgi:hypothetical protein
MQNDVQQQILKAFFIVLRPIARILLRFGIGFREFSEVAKAAFVDVATSDYGLRGRPTNISRVAVMTGLTRKEVRRVREKIKEGAAANVVKTTPMSEIIHRWYTEPDFLNSSGGPAALPFDGEDPSFTSLVRRFGGDIPPGAMRTELKRVGAVVENSDGTLRVVKRTIHPKGTHEKLAAGLVHALYPLASTIAHNTNPGREDDIWPQFSTYSQAIRKGDVARLRRIGSDRLLEVAESFDDLFGAYETLHEKEVESANQQTLAVGVFYFEERDSAMEGKW